MTKIPIYTADDREHNVEVQILGFSPDFARKKNASRPRKRRSMRYAEKIMNDPLVMNA